MTITFPRRVRRQAEEGAAGKPGSGRIDLIVTASLLGSTVSAAILTLGVLAGAREHIITGSALLAFASGWAALAGLSAQWTSQPQRWALVPAGYLAVLGASILVLAPGDGTLSAAGWAWPAGLLALTVWIVGQARRRLHGWSRRWLLYPVCALMALIAVGGSTETALEARAPQHPSAGRTYPVGGHRMYLHCEGTGSPTVLLTSGYGAHSPSWGWVLPAVAAVTRVCSYDRAGQGWSGSAGPQDGMALATDLHTLLQTAHEPGPYVLAGHSVGGVYDMIFAARYPRETAGMVLLDSATPEQFGLPSYPGAYALWRRASGVLPSLARFGTARLLWGSGFDGLPAQSRREERMFACEARNLRGERDEWAELPTVFDQAKALRSLGAEPLVVLTAVRGAPAGWAAAQDQLAALSSNRSHRSLNAASHAVLLEDRQFAAESSRAIRDVVTAVRTGAHVAA